jgi:hypothetical protein
MLLLLLSLLALGQDTDEPLVMVGPPLPDDLVEVEVVETVEEVEEAVEEDLTVKERIDRVEEQAQQTSALLVALQGAIEAEEAAAGEDPPEEDEEEAVEPEDK